MIEIRCSCGKSGTVPDDLAGRRIRCQSCQSSLRVPAVDDTDPLHGRDPPSPKRQMTAETRDEAPALFDDSDKLFPDAPPPRPSRRLSRPPEERRRTTGERRVTPPDEESDPPAPRPSQRNRRTTERRAARPTSERRSAADEESDGTAPLRPSQRDPRRTSERAPAPLFADSEKYFPEDTPPLPRAARPISALERNLTHEGHLRAIAFWHRAGGALAAVALVFTLHFLSRVNRPLDAFSTVLVFFLLVLSVASFAIGHALARYVNAARFWAIAASLAGMIVPFFRAVSEGRPGAAVLSLVVLAWFVAAAWALNHPRAATICSDVYREAVARDESTRVPWWQSPFLWGPAATLLALVGVAVAVLASTVKTVR